MFQINMAEMVFVKAECDTLDLKEELIEEEDPLLSKEGNTFLAFIHLTIHHIDIFSHY